MKMNDRVQAIIIMSNKAHNLLHNCGLGYCEPIIMVIKQVKCQTERPDKKIILLTIACFFQLSVIIHKSDLRTHSLQ